MIGQHISYDSVLLYVNTHKTAWCNWCYVYIQYTYITKKSKFYLCEFQKQVEKQTFGLFRSECKLILHLPTMYLYCIYLAMPRKVQKQIQNYLKRAETIVILIVFNDVPSDVRTYILLPSFTVALHESGNRESFIRSITR